MKINKKKLRDELLSIGGVVLGIIWCVLGFTKTVPGTDGQFQTFVTALIAYGPLLGIVLAVCSAGAFVEILETNYSRRKGAR